MLELEVLKEEIENINRELGEIFNYLETNEEITNYRGLLLGLKLLLLRIKEYDIKIKASNIMIEANKNIKVVDIIHKIMIAISIIIFLMNPLIGGFFLVESYIISKLKNDMVNNKRNNLFFRRILNISASNDNIISNCERLIRRKNFKFNKKTVSISLENTEILANDYLAEEAIDMFISYDILIPVSPEVEDIMRKILQSDLNTDEVGINHLLNMAKAKLNKENSEKIIHTAERKRVKSEEILKKFQ